MEAVTIAAWEPDLGLSDEIEAQFGRAIAAYRANPNLITEHARHEESIRTGGYANRTLLELVQNAADAMAGEASGGRVEIVLDPEKATLYCANEGRPFSKQGIIAIEHAHLSAKRGDEIGRFGLGFKSVLAVTGRPQVFSRSVSFEFNSPVARSAVTSIIGAHESLPALRTATAVDAGREFGNDGTLRDLATWATTIIKLPDVTNIGRLKHDIESFDSEFLLFVTAVREIRLRVLGAVGFDVRHVSKPLGHDMFRIERSEYHADSGRDAEIDADGAEWIVKDTMHRPSADARREVGETVSREAVKVTVAVPVRHAERRLGEFWSYFPLQDRTTASALFNAPWSVNDDRTTLLHNDYNREILETVSGLFVEALTALGTADDPASHLDYLPARGRESRSFGDDVLCDRVPRIAATRKMVPDAGGRLHLASAFKPLNFEAPVDHTVYRAWMEAPGTPANFPHWRCYATAQRMARLRQLFVAAFAAPGHVDDGRDLKKSLAAVPQTGLLTWLRLWASGDLQAAADALRFVRGNLKVESIENAPVIPTTAGLRGLAHRSKVFLRQEPGVEIEDASFVLPEFLALDGVEKLLRSEGFRNLDPAAILLARMAHLTPEADEDSLIRLWDSALDVPVRQASKLLADPTNAGAGYVRVPTRSGGWQWPQKVIDLDHETDDRFASLLLDKSRCVPEVAHSLGVATQPQEGFDIEDEFFGDEYQSWVLETLNSNRGPGERPVERVELFPPADDSSRGPVSALLVLAASGGPDHDRVLWTMGLLAGSAEFWDCEDIDSGLNHKVLSPVRWAVDRAGLVMTTRGCVPPRRAVDSGLVQYAELLPLFQGPRAVAATLAPPKELSQVDPDTLRSALQTPHLARTIPDTALVDFIVGACRSAYPGSRPPGIPARVGRAVENRPPESVFVAENEEQRDYLENRQRPYLYATEESADALVSVVGCRRFQDSFSFSLVVEGRQPAQRVLDVFTGLRSVATAHSLTNAMVVRAGRITKLVTTEDGVEDKSLESHLDGVTLVVSELVDDDRVLHLVNEAFDLSLTNAQLVDVRKKGLAHELEAMRVDAKSADNDADRLAAYFGDDDLREALPRGLWSALAAQGLVDRNTAVGELFLTVYGSDSVKLLADNFRQLGFTDVPTMWAGNSATISWLRDMGFGSEYGGRRGERRDAEFVVPGATILNPLHDFQERIRSELNEVLTVRDARGRASKAMVELPTGAGKTRVASETVLRLFIEGRLRGPVLWIAQSQELCEQAVQTWSTVWRGLADERPLTVARLWDNNDVHEPDTEFSIIVATDAKLRVIIEQESDDYEWLRNASAVIVDEGHRAGASALYTRILTWLGIAGHGYERPLVGLSATPFKGKSEEATKSLVARFGNRKISAFDERAYQELAGLGVLARVKHQVLQGVDVALTPAQRREATEMRRISPEVLDRIGASHDRMSVLVEHILGLDPDWPVLVFTPSVLSAQLLAAVLRYRGVEAAAVSGQTSRQERRDVIERFKARELRVLTNCDLLIQGFDAPGVRALYIARPTFSPNAYIQMAGRGLRGPANGGKEECLIVDLADSFGDSNADELLGFREYEDLWQRQDA
ncbi:sacsin N-terminal ATP-binding-like domain-containing protein [Demequina pelophila]|uniref:sacsin N-terminal ATP-binding-like domain-containing protein n=1 Tax=Demequina pelophila TaxID=1638984 RepID=UPI00078083FE|nr:DEAD/DEAH box helicase family protein [Demequina pelophila]